MGSENLGGSATQAVLIMGDGAPAKALKEALAEQGYDIVGTAATAATATKLFKSKQPNVVVVHLSPGRLDAARAIPALLELRQCPIVAVAEAASTELIDAACAACACGYVTGATVSGPALAAQIRVSVSRFNAFEKLQQEKAEISQILETRKYVDRAKAVLMKRGGLTEPEAHRRLQQESQKRRLNIGEVARRIVESDEIMGDGGA